MSEGPFDINNLDDMSREAANEHTLPFKESSWDKMELLLNEDKKRRFAFWWWWIPVLFIFVTGGVYFAIKTTNKKADTNKADIIKTENNKLLVPFETAQQKQDKINKNNKNTATEIAANKQSVSTFDSDKETKDTINKISLTNKRNIDYLTVKKENKNNIQSLKNKNDAHNADLNPTVIINSNNNKYLNKTPYNNNKTIEQTPILDTTIKVGNAGGNLNKDSANNALNNNPILALESGKPQNAKNNNIENNSNKNELDIALNELKEIAIKKTNIDSAQKTAVIKLTDTTLNTTKKLNKITPTKLSKFEFSALIEADLSMVKFKKVEKLSNGFGIGVSYKLAKRWSVGTGISYSTKLYVADSTDYKKAVYNAWGLTVLNIDANCKVIEIPISVQYLIGQKKKSTWFATAGISSYFMKSEDYDYTILKNGMVKNMDYYYKNENKHILSILTLQADYNKQINNQFSWQLSPFIKLPLTGIGEGHVSLESFGLQFALHFRPKKK